MEFKSPLGLLLVQTERPTAEAPAGRSAAGWWVLFKSVIRVTWALDTPGLKFVSELAPEEVLELRTPPLGYLFCGAIPTEVNLGDPRMVDDRGGHPAGVRSHFPPRTWSPGVPGPPPILPRREVTTHLTLPSIYADIVKAHTNRHNLPHVGKFDI